MDDPLATVVHAIAEGLAATGLLWVTVGDSLLRGADAWTALARSLESAGE